ncbi:energy transducer TonB [Hymenobacter tenuis]
MLPLPILNVQLNACHEDWQQMTPVAKGLYCAACERVVLDFTSSSQADLAAAFQASSDGRVCGQFRPEQLAPRPRLRLHLSRFLVALVLVCGLGLTGQEAIAQVLKPSITPFSAQKAENPKEIPDKQLLSRQKECEDSSTSPPFFGMVVEQMPVYKGGQEALLRFIGQNIQWPDAAPNTLNGRIFVQFLITETGAVRNVCVLKGLHPALDTEAVRVVKLLDGKFTPGKQNNRPVSVTYTVPITFQGSAAPALPSKR